MKRLYLLIIALGPVLGMQAQSIDDVELFNTRDLHGTPRFIGMGGAFTALGNDLSAIHINPAASSVFRQDNFGLSLGFQTREGAQGFYDGNAGSSDFSFLFENIGLVKKFEVGGYKNKTELAFSLGYTKLAEFNRDYTVVANRPVGPIGEGTLAGYWIDEKFYPDGGNGIVGLTPDQLFDEEYAAYQAGLFITDTNDVIEDLSFGNGSPSMYKLRYSRQERGSFNEFHIGLGGAYNDVFHYGFALGFPTLSYTNDDLINEYNLPTDSFPFDANSYTLNRTNEIYGNGINIKLEAIVKPAQWFRLGLSYQSPSWYTVTQMYQIDMTARFDNGDLGESDIISTGEYRYKLRTPAIYRAGGAFIFGKRGLLSVDYEYSDPSQSRTYTNGGSYNVLEDDLQSSNSVLSSVMKSSQAIKVGGEYRVGPVMLRAGYGFRQSFYQNPEDFKSDQSTISGGIGYQNQDFSIDLSYSRSVFSRQDYVHPFYINNNGGEELVDSDMIRSNIVLGVGFRF